ncbi:Gfo/Idh/MocA family oxidoreductase (plasmid) [Haloferacaceae archaeon DSL9]
MTETALAAGVIGVGSMGRHHARVYHELPNIDLVGVFDVNDEAAEATAAAYDTTARSIESLLDAADVVSIVVPTEYHYEMAMRAIEADVHAIVEKPFVDDLAEGRALIEAADDADLVLQVGHIERFNPAIQTLSEIATGLEILAIETRRLGPPIERGIADGVVLDLMIHDLDIVLSLVDSPIARIDATEAANEQYVAVTLQFENDVVVTLTASRITQQKIRELAITASDCRVNVDYISQSVTINRHSLPEYIENDGNLRYRCENIVERPTVENGEPLKKELTAFTESVRNGSPPVVSGEDGLRVLEVAQQIRSIAQKQ